MPYRTAKPGRSRRRPFFFLLLTVLAGAGTCPHALSENLRWRTPGAKLRARVVNRDEGRFCRVELPARLPDGRPVAQVMAVSGASRIPHRIAWRDDKSLDVWLDLAAGDDRHGIHLYGIPGDSPVAPAASIFSAERPVSVSVWRQRGLDRASTWDMMLWAREQFGDPVISFNLPVFADVDGSSGDHTWLRRQGANPFHLFRLAAAMRVEEPRSGRFAVQSSKPTVVRLDGSMGADWTGGERHGDWHLGDPVRFNPGLRTIEVFQSGHNISLRLGIWWEGDDQPTIIENRHLLPDLAPAETIIEHVDQLLHPYMHIGYLNPYKFSSRATVFHPIELTDRSRSALGEVRQVQWGQAGEVWGRGKVLRHILPDSSPPYVESRVTDSLGFSRCHTGAVSFAALPAREFLVGAEWSNLPAMAWPDDRIMPVLRVQTTAPDDMPLEVEFYLTTTFGKTRHWREKANRSQGVGLVTVPEIAIADLASLSATIRHARVEIKRLDVQCVHPPFRRLPDKVSGNAIIGPDGSQWILSPRRRPRKQQPVLPVVSGRRLLWIEEPWPSPDPVAAEAARNDIIHRLEPMLEAESLEIFCLDGDGKDTDGVYELIRPLPDLSRFAGRHVAVLAIAEAAAIRKVPVEQFERKLGAVIGLLQEVVGLELVPATPLPFGDPEQSRPYAMAVHRVADAYGLPVLDRFTFVLTHPGDQPLLSGHQVTQYGIQRMTPWIAGRFSR